mgnify:CR=1 FL=1
MQKIFLIYLQIHKYQGKSKILLLVGISPLRIGFAGGGTDLEEYHEKYTGQTISATINKFTYVFARLRNDNKLQSFSPDFTSYLPPKTVKLE